MKCELKDRTFWEYVAMGRTFLDTLVSITDAQGATANEDIASVVGKENSPRDEVMMGNQAQTRNAMAMRLTRPVTNHTKHHKHLL
jgi:type IV secretory pathway TrbL component